MKDYYALLNVSPDASLAQIDAAYRRLVQRHHPNARSSPQALERLRELNEAWRVLSDPTLRAAYDQARANGTPYQPPSPPPTLRNVPQASFADFGARHATRSSCLVPIAVLLVLLFALGILAWGLNEQLNFAAMWERAANEVSALLPTREASATKSAQAEPTPTPDPRCRDGCETPPPGCVVKGDVETNGTHYFYLPNDEGYARIVVDIAKGDRWFCALNDAQAAGWTRKAPTETPTLPPPPEAFTTNITRRAFLVCADNAALHEGPGDEFPIAQTVAKDARVFVTGVNGEWSVVTANNAAFYIRSNQLCAPPTRAAAQVTTAPSVNDPTPTASSSANAQSAAPALKYPAPQILKPSFGERYWCNRELVLEWSAPAALAPDEYFLVESKLVEHDHWNALADWTKDTTVMLYPNRGGGECDTVWWSNTGVYEWRVSVVRGSKQTPTYLSPFSEPSRINYGK